MNALKREIRQALLGDLVSGADGRLEVSFTRLTKYRTGLADGYDKVRIFGVMCRRRWYVSTKNDRQLHQLAVRGMQDMGRMISLSSDPDKEAVYCAYLLNTPAIVTYSRGKDGVVEVAAYAARGLSGWLACFRSLNRFQKKVPDVLQRMSEESEREQQRAVREENAQDRLQLKQTKKDKKQEKKRLRKEKRKARVQRMVGVLPKVPKRVPANPAAEEQTAKAVTNVAGADPTAEAATNAAGMEPIAEAAAIDAMRAEQARLETEAERAKLAAKAAQAKLEAARAKLEAEEAQAKLAEVEAKLADQERRKKK